MVMTEERVVSTLTCDEGGDCASTCICTDVGTRCDCACAEDGNVCNHGEKNPKPKEKSKRSKKAKATQAKLPGPVDELPEYKEAVQWAAGVSAEAEKKIARETSHIPIGVMLRLESLVGKQITARAFEMVQLWNGIAAEGTRPGQGDFHSIHEVMEGLACLPAQGENVAKWWHDIGYSSTSGYPEGINFYMLIVGHRSCYSDSAIQLRSALRGALASLLSEIPGPSKVMAIRQVREMAKPEKERSAVTLSELTSLINGFEWRRDRIETEGYESRKRYSVKEVQQQLTNDGLENYVVDCGEVRDTQQMRDAISEFGARVRGCSECGNWFAVAEDKVPYDWYKYCPGCERDGPNGIIVGGFNGTFEKGLIVYMREQTEKTIDVAVHLAMAEGTTVAHARQLLDGDSDKTPAEVASELRTCPMAGACQTKCAKMQVEGIRSIPITPKDGNYESCALYGFWGMVADVSDQETRDRVARQFMDQIAGSRHSAKKQSPMVKQETLIEAGEQSTEEPVAAVEPEIQVQTSLF